MSEGLRPSATSPGLHIKGGSYSTAPTGEYACHCGATDSAKGTTAVKALVEAYSDHKASHAEAGR
ncbi:hypothetical protein [Actinacidiphila bryophytorum]|uniref:Uncharacterized protein n=1 Tax=Actinacidiphila bryophytorum TaxID=1436133 RepID=A0A9W4GZF5_9ACTN|nr:hypothetical protein [Actinacidiphila bryophytorum]MBM9434446.1 hypothetical protein [Actinacidiphila bryophytorum]MBN6541920.1 hypothetical protein [Actinacidiphila bryophytorum]CAG7626195.1 conserved hypothetical protein [Actinacidiphila bryophytorum]